MSKTVWVDLDNTPHVPFFVPIIRALEREGHRVIVTARDAFQVCSLAAYHGLACRVVGRHNGANKVMKVVGTLWRAGQLLPLTRREKPDVALSHGSRPLELVSFLLRIPSLRLFDYEHSTELPFVRPTLGVAPDSIDDPSLPRLFRRGLRTYRGLKEDVYVPAFRPDASLLTELGIGEDEIVVTMRPPASEAHYHNPESDRLFVDVVNTIGAVNGTRMVILPRNVSTQGGFIQQTWPDWCRTRKIVVVDRPVDGLNLIWFSDLVVSGGGTMNREAAAMGVPVYSIFCGTLGAVDRALADQGRLVLIQRQEDVSTKLRIVKRMREWNDVSLDRPALQQILTATRELLEMSQAHRA